MTTGRINQVTIVRRGWPTGAAGTPEKIQVTGWRPEARPDSAAGRALGAAGAVRFPPLSSPRRPSSAPSPLWAGRSRCRSGRTGTRRVSHGGVSGALFPPAALRVASQGPVVHRAHPPAGTPLRGPPWGIGVRQLISWWPAPPRSTGATTARWGRVASTLYKRSLANVCMIRYVLQRVGAPVLGGLGL